MPRSPQTNDNKEQPISLHIDCHPRLTRFIQHLAFSSLIFVGPKVDLSPPTNLLILKIDTFNFIFLGAPTKPKFKLGIANDERSPEIMWTVESYQPVIEYEFQYKKLQVNHFCMFCTCKRSRRCGRRERLHCLLLWLLFRFHLKLEFDGHEF